MHQIIAIYGHAQCGKSACINYVRELLREGGESLSSNPPYSGDKCETFRYKGQIICVCPGGDTDEVIKANFEYAISKNADVVITGCRSKGAPVDWVEWYANEYDATLIWKRKSVEYELSKETQDLCNREYARVIFGLL